MAELITKDALKHLLCRFSTIFSYACKRAPNFFLLGV